MCVPLLCAPLVFRLTDNRLTPQSYDRTRTILSLSLEIDHVLQPPRISETLNSGFMRGQVTEVWGLPGVGKTQLCLQLALNVQVSAMVGGQEGEALYIDTEGAFSVLRLEEMAGALHHHIHRVVYSRSTTPPTVRERFKDNADEICGSVEPARLLAGVHLLRVTDAAGLREALRELPAYLAAHAAIRLVVIDSVAFHFRYPAHKDENGSDVAVVTARSRALGAMSVRLGVIARDAEVALVCVNHAVHDNAGAWTEEGTRSGREQSGVMVPALGDAWASSVAGRIWLGWADERGVRTVQASKLLWTGPQTVGLFSLGKDGIRNVKTGTARPEAAAGAGSKRPKAEGEGASK